MVKQFEKVYLTECVLCACENQGSSKQARQPRLKVIGYFVPNAFLLIALQTERGFVLAVVDDSCIYDVTIQFCAEQTLLLL